MTSGMWNETRGQGWRPLSRFASGVVLCLLVTGGPSLFAMRGGGGQRGQGSRPAPAARPVQPGGNGAPRMNGNGGMRPGMNGGRAGGYPVVRPGTSAMRPGQEHLPEWLSHHENLSPSQQENLLRQEPGFNRLPAEQQQRLMDRLRTLDARPPMERQRTLARNEAFERLSPEGKQDVRAAAQSLNQMPPDRQRMVRRAFNDLRQIPTQQRAEILNSARFSQSFTPQERHMLGSLLSIEPYEAR